MFYSMQHHILKAVNKHTVSVYHFNKTLVLVFFVIQINSFPYQIESRDILRTQFPNCKSFHLYNNLKQVITIFSPYCTMPETFIDLPKTT